MREENKSKKNQSADLYALQNVDAGVFDVATVEKIEYLHKGVQIVDECQMTGEQLVQTERIFVGRSLNKRICVETISNI